MHVMSCGAVWTMLANRPHRPYGARPHAASSIPLWKVLCAKRASDDSGGSAIHLGDRLPTTFRDTFIVEVYAFPFHLAGRYAMYGPATGFVRESGLQNWILSDNPLRPSRLN